MRYEEGNGKSWRVDDEGTIELMSNFLAEIVEETRYIAGTGTRTILRIRGQINKPDDPDGKEKPLELPTVEVSTDDWAGFGWVIANWGIRCVIRPISSVKEDLRTMIQLRSKPSVRTVYGATGWQEIDGKRHYLHGGGAIGPKGNDDTVEVRLPPELSRYNLATEVKPADGIRATLTLLGLATPEVVWPMLAACFAPLYGPVDYAVHVTGRTGSFKSECMSLFQSHYGPGMDSRHLPGSWSSTPNALEAQAYLARNAVFVIDDFVPQGSSSQQKSYQMAADKIIRAQGNQAGRARLTDLSSLQETMYPRGCIFSTGEDTPEGHSCRGRMMILELAPGNITPEALSRAQAVRSQYVATTAFLCQSLAQRPADLDDRRGLLRRELLKVGHTRTPSMLASMISVAEDVLSRFAQVGGISTAAAAKMAKEARAAIVKAGEGQSQYLEDADPVEQLFQAIRVMMATGSAHFATLNDGIPSKAGQLGWQEQRASIGEMSTYKRNGQCLGWVDVPKDMLYLDSDSGLPTVLKWLKGAIALKEQTLLKRLKDGGKLKRTDATRSRNTIRVTAANHPRQVIALSLSEVLQLEDLHDDEAD
jgi:hypothetical protein